MLRYFKQNILHYFVNVIDDDLGRRMRHCCLLMGHLDTYRGRATAIVTPSAPFVDFRVARPRFRHSTFLSFGLTRERCSAQATTIT